jgi:hypothetical protein
MQVDDNPNEVYDNIQLDTFILYKKTLFLIYNNFIQFYLMKNKFNNRAYIHVNMCKHWNQLEGWRHKAKWNKPHIFVEFIGYQVD